MSGERLVGVERKCVCVVIVSHEKFMVSMCVPAVFGLHLDLVIIYPWIFMIRCLVTKTDSDSSQHRDYILSRV